MTCKTCANSGTITVGNRFVPCPVCHCWMCQDTGVVTESICGWCEEGAYHTHCDDTYYTEHECPVCKEKKELINEISGRTVGYC